MISIIMGLTAKWGSRGALCILYTSSTVALQMFWSLPFTALDFAPYFSTPPYYAHSGVLV